MSVLVCVWCVHMSVYSLVSFPQVITLHYSSIIHHSFIILLVLLATVMPVGLHHCGPPANSWQQNNGIRFLSCVHVDIHGCNIVSHVYVYFYRIGQLQITYYTTIDYIYEYWLYWTVGGSILLVTWRSWFVIMWIRGQVGEMWRGKVKDKWLPLN